MSHTILALTPVSLAHLSLMAAPPDQPHPERPAAPFAKEAQRYSDIATQKKTAPDGSPRQSTEPSALRQNERDTQRNRVSTSRTRLTTLEEKLKIAKRQAGTKTKGVAALIHERDLVETRIVKLRQQVDDAGKETAVALARARQIEADSLSPTDAAAIARFLTLADSTFLHGVSLVEQKRLKDGWVKMLEVFDEIDQSRMHAYARDALVHEASDLCASCLGDFSVKVVPGGMEFYNFGNVTAADVYYYSSENRLLVRSQLAIRRPRSFVRLPNLATRAGRLEIHTSNTHRIYGWPDFRRIWPEGSTRGDSQFPTAHSYDDSVYRRAN